MLDEGHGRGKTSLEQQVRDISVSNKSQFPRLDSSFMRAPWANVLSLESS